MLKLLLKTIARSALIPGVTLCICLVYSSVTIAQTIVEGSDTGWLQ